MPDDGIDRRHFMVAAVGASTALSDPADAHATTAARGTVYASDLIDGKKVISARDINDLEAGKKHLFHFQGVQMATGRHWHMSTILRKVRGRASASRSQQPAR
jgi:hypothetical protein